MSRTDDFRDDTGPTAGPKTRAYLAAMCDQLDAIRGLLDLRQRLSVLQKHLRDLANGGQTPGPAHAQAEAGELGALAAALGPRVTAATDRARETLRDAAAAWASGEEAEPVRERMRLTAAYDQLVAAAQSGAAGAVQ